MYQEQGAQSSEPLFFIKMFQLIQIVLIYPYQKLIMSI